MGIHGAFEIAQLMTTDTKVKAALEVGRLAALKVEISDSNGVALDCLIKNFCNSNEIANQFARLFLGKSLAIKSFYEKKIFKKNSDTGEDDSFSFPTFLDLINCLTEKKEYENAIKLDEGVLNSRYKEDIKEAEKASCSLFDKSSDKPAQRAFHIRYAQ